MKILWLTPLFPYPLYSGGQIRAYHLIKNLALKHQITLFSFMRPGREQGPIKEMAKYCSQVKTFKGRKTWTARNVLLAGFSHLPFAISHFWGNLGLKRALDNELKKGDYDLVHFESFYTIPYLQAGLRVPSVLGNQNIEHQIYQRFVDGKKQILLKTLLGYDVAKMKRYEEQAWKKADLNLAVSDIDAKKIQKITGKKCVVVPNGIDLDYFKSFRISRPSENRPDLLFVGDFNYFANQDAIRFFIKNIWPLVKAKLPDVKLWLVGSNPGKFGQKLAAKDIVVDDRVADIRQAFVQSDLMVAPMRLGSGTSLKVLEAMACGLPVVATPVGVEGIKVKKGRDVIVQNDPKDFAKEIVDLLEDKTRRLKIGRAGQKQVEKNYQWSDIAKKLDSAYQELTNAKKKN